MSAASHSPPQPSTGSGPDPHKAPPAPILSSLQSRSELAELLGISHQALTWMLYRRRPDSYYKTWSIKKRSGGTREISAPTSTLYRVQKTLNSILQGVYEPKPAAQGFVKSRNVVTNARPHVNRRFVLNVDLVDFFPSINFGRVLGLFRAPPLECTEEVAATIAHICCNRGSLPIGAPTSPVISNMICLRMDAELQKLAKKTGCWYSRYADDLTLSTNRSTFPATVARVDDEGIVEVGDALRGIIESNGFFTNAAKTRLQSKGNRQVVTGVLVNERLNLDRRYIRRIRAMLHAWDRYGLESAQSACAERYTKDRFPGADPRFVDILRGRIAYAEMVRGSTDPLAIRFKMQFSNLSKELPINEGIPEALVEDAAGDLPLALDDGAMSALSTVAVDVYDRWKGRVDPAAKRALKAIEVYRGARHDDDVRMAVVELAGALELLRPHVKKFLTKKDEGALFNIANNFGLRHVREDQLTEYGGEFLVWIFQFYLHTVDLVDQLMARSIERPDGPEPPTAS